ncbi:hypothetical protein [Pseudomonas sp. OF001]|uniref:hypothetical protein n=1 Tax=Pseudomonas sp. OF001 TaxID=2772300 RepID=UPI00191A821B|nr:hypothetical protein [Pseudomonas sp. OF001]
MIQKVRLKSFNGSLTPPKNTEPEENYWLLIGSYGELVERKNARGRALVKFDTSVKSLGLACHNEVENSLYILEADLEIIE